MNVCTRCGFEVTRSCRVHSRHTGRYFCADLVECERRSKNKLTMFEINWFAERALSELKRTQRLLKREARKAVT